ncbi:TetR/AcrR family transcriptional regulator [Aldersonia kunmingensis]|uniref:TetR/AcrR family transcriptional regulator n=1 Tax=Aldersonia kunmingensis TaxID=408066 RepID=UPI0008295F64|nr:TetR/AcrR family transcriptional regulator [Aldersonia kunmingensis]
MTTTATQPGRPRDPEKDAAVIEATRQLLVEKGYQGTTVVAVARRANVGAPTIYRRWPTKEALVEEVAFGHARPAPVPSATGDLATDLRAWVEMFLDWLSEPVTRAALLGLLAAYHRDESIYERLVLHSEQDVRALMFDMLANDLPQLATGEINERADAVFDLLVASTVVRAMTGGRSDRETYCAKTTRALAALARTEWE